MHFIDLLTVDSVHIGVTVRTKKRLLELASEILGRDADGPDCRSIFMALCTRERLGSTALGHGVALPHGRLSDLDRVRGALIRTRDPIEFEAPDAEPVDLFFALAVPDQRHDEHLRMLSQLAELVSDEARRGALRSANDSVATLRLLQDWHAHQVTE